MANEQSYELLVIFDAKVEEADIKREFDIVQSLIENRAAKFLGRAEWGLRDFQFPIKRRTSGHYVYYLFQAHPDFPTQLSHALKMDEKVLRHMIIKGNTKSEGYLTAKERPDFSRAFKRDFTADVENEGYGGRYESNRKGDDDGAEEKN